MRNAALYGIPDMISSVTPRHTSAVTGPPLESSAICTFRATPARISSTNFAKLGRRRRNVFRNRQTRSYGGEVTTISSQAGSARTPNKPRLAEKQGDCGDRRLCNCKNGSHPLFPLFHRPRFTAFASGSWLPDLCAPVDTTRGRAIPQSDSYYHPPWFPTIGNFVPRRTSHRAQVRAAPYCAPTLSKKAHGS